MDGQLVVSASTVSMFLLELIKFTVRTWVVKDQEYDFDPTFYKLMVPFLTAVSGICLGLVGWSDPVQFSPNDLIQWGVSIVLTYGMYYFSVKQVKNYTKRYNNPD